jgi:tetratricopeptide (TPR) repeat protein
MSRDGHAENDPGGVARLRLVDRLCTEFEKAWRTGRPRIEEFLADWQGEQRLELLRELVALDVLCRRRRGEQCLAADYERFPELSADGLAAALAGPPSAPDQRTSARQERTPLAEDADVPAQVGRYRIEDEVGRGAMGVVLRAHDADFGRALAIKVLLPCHRGNAELERRFREEARLTGQLQHPGVPAAHEMGTLPDGRPFFALKLVQGRTLAELLAARTAPTEDLPRWLGIFEHLCQAVAYAHSRGVIHRDLKPGNVMVGAFGEVQVMDWGLAKLLAAEAAEPSAAEPEASTVYTGRAEGALTQAGTVLGTYAYMPPEQARGEVSRIDERADVFGLGAILCEVLTGSPPYGREQVQRQARQADLADAFARLDRCGAERELVALARACLAAEPDERPRHAGAVAHAVGAYLAGVQQRLRQAELERARAEVQLTEERRQAEVQAVEQRKRQRLWLALAGSVLVLLGGLGGGWLYLHGQRVEAWAQRARRADRARQGIQAALTQTAGLLARARWAEAEALLAQARGRLAEADDPDLAERLRRADRELSLARQLDRVRQEKATLVEGKFNPRKAAPAYREALAGHGLNVLGGEPTQLATDIRRLGVWAQVVAALDDWAFAEQDAARRRRLLAVARRADPGAWKDRVRDPALWEDNEGAKERLRRLALRTEGEELSPALAVVLGELLEEAGADGVALMRRVQADSPADFWLCLTLANTLRQKGSKRLEEAVGYYRAALALRPDSSVAHNNLGVALHGNGKVEEAIACYHRAIAADPKAAHAHNNLGLALQDKGELGGAMACYRKAIAVDPRHAPAHYNLGVALDGTGQVEEAIACYRRAIAADPKCAQAHHNLGLLLEGLLPLAAPSLLTPRIPRPPTAADPEDSAASYRRAIAADHEDSAAHNNLGVALHGKGEVDQAIASYRRAVAANPKDALAHTNLGLALKAKGQVEQAIECFRTAIAADPKFAPAHTHLGNALSGTRQVERAIACYRKAIAADPKCAQAHYNLGVALQDKGEVGEAIVCYRRAIAADPRHAPAHSNLGLALQDRGQFEEAMACYRRAIAADPKFAKAHGALGQALLHQGRFAQADAVTRRCLDLLPPAHPLRIMVSRQLQQCQRLLYLDDWLAAIRQGKATPRDASERLSLARWCQQPYKRLYATAARLYTEAFALQPSLAADLNAAHRYNAACCAARAARGDGVDAPAGATERARLRARTLAWLRADLALLKKRAADPAQRRMAAAWLAHCLGDADLDRGWSALPAGERAEWDAFWADVRATLAAALNPSPPAKPAPPPREVKGP